MSMHAIGADGERRPIHVGGANRLLGPDDVGRSRRAAPVPSTSVGSTCCPGSGPLPLAWSRRGAPPARPRASTSSAAARATPTVDWPALLPHIDWFLPNDAQLLELSGCTGLPDAISWALDRGARRVW